MNASVDAFDPDLPGTADRLWLDMLHAQPRWSPHTDFLIVVSPHPDDEVLGAGGLIASYARRQAWVVVISVTDGESAYPDWSGLDLVRRNELKTALAQLGAARVPVVRLGLPDGQVRFHLGTLRNALSKWVTPSVTLIAPYEEDGHPDHDAVGRTCLQLAHERQALIARYPIWAWHRSDPRTLSGLRWGRFELDGATREAKRRAIETFASQLKPPSVRKPIVPAHVLPYFMRSFEALIL